MSSTDLDDIDRGILHLLQMDARNNTDAEIAEAVDVSASTVGNRLRKMEDDEVISGYTPQVNYEEAGLQLHTEFICSAPIADQGDLADEAIELYGVVRVREMLRGGENVRVEAVSETFQELEELTEALDEIGLQIRDTEIIKHVRTRPFDHFGSDRVED